MATGTEGFVITFSDMAAATGGRILFPARISEGASRVAVDSRAVQPGSLFVALPGERTDGHEFLGQAAAAGAAVMIVSEAQAGRRSAEIAGIAAGGVGVISVPDTLRALQEMARFHMRRLPSVTRIGVTGSNGKTTTKEIIGAILTRAAPTAMNAGNLNSEIGLPIACFSVEAAHRYAVLEMGMNHVGEMQVLADIVRPDIALLTNIGTAHIGLLGSREAIAGEKKKIFMYFDGRQTAVLPEDTPYRDFLMAGVNGKAVFYGPKSTPGYRGSESQGLGGTIIHWEGSRIRFPLFGPYNLANALGALTVARELGVPNAEIRDGLEAVAPLFGRSQIISGPVTVLVDCYNANPDSMESALSFVEALPWEGRKIAVLGSMRELGEETAAAHRELGERLRSSSCQALFLYGEEMRDAWDALQPAPRGIPCAWLTDREALGSQIESFVKPGDLVLLKGSRSLELERLLPRVTRVGYGKTGEGGA
ncbi:MAG: UDP-N-acetylmuramoyl-tripeptide--D-alanyl-D-alanine ligase [Spirochaetia bacterium]|jgi:UDP-N-acetylmuramoyl-tripeptide--D-alanyl-D-alanine ligase